MTSVDYQALEYFFTRYSYTSALALLRKRLEDLISQQHGKTTIDEVIQIYQSAVPLIEKEFWSEELEASRIEMYQQLFQELEALIALQGQDTRHHFIVIIPVADRPKHLQSCLQSLLQLCQSFHYGGYTRQRFSKVTAIIADDTKDQANIQRHMEISDHFNAQGLKTIYFGINEQREQLERLTNNQRKNLSNILGAFDTSAFFHKGPSRMRNITYLKLDELSKTGKNLLFYFVDSDQEFQVRIQSEGKDKDIYALNYFYALDEIFSLHDVSILSGKVVGDPPVSPAVMAGTFLDDIIAFLQCTASSDPTHACQFHYLSPRKQHEAAYHDMTELFGFKPSAQAYHYRCGLTGEHDQADCFSDFSRKLNHFFYGEHPTRESYFNHEDTASNIKPARTIYTGNYVFNSDGLKYFIPFAKLKLRMAGPVLGRIIKSEINQRFVTVNLPMLHNRTVEDSGESEFRPGIQNESEIIDLSGEFERQFYGDVMLFTVEKLTAMGYPTQSIPKSRIFQLLEDTEEALRQRYTTKRDQILDKLRLLKTLFYDRNQWWHSVDSLKEARVHFTSFMRNIEHNFAVDSRCYALIHSDKNRSRHLNDMLEAIADYSQDRQFWADTLQLENR